jgi:hypothetical protein
MATSVASLLKLVDNGTTNNYPDWSSFMLTYFMCTTVEDINLLQVVKGTSKRPTLSPDAKEEDASKVLARQFKWDKADKSAVLVIKTTIPEALLPTIRHLDTSQEVWQHLESAYDNSTATSIATKVGALFQVRLEATSNMSTYLSTFFNIWTELKTLGVNMDEPILCAILIYCLPDEYLLERGILVQGKREDLVLAKIRPYLLNAELNHKAQSAHALNASPGPRNPGRRNSFPPCQYVAQRGPYKGKRCNGTNHPTTTCFRKLNDWFFAKTGKTGKKWSVMDKALLLECGKLADSNGAVPQALWASPQDVKDDPPQDEDTHDPRANVMFGNIEGPFSSAYLASYHAQEGILDSGCTDHVIGSASAMTDYTHLHTPLPISGFGSNMACSAVGKGSILLPSNPPTTSPGALHVPSVRHNLYSISRLQDAGLGTYFPPRSSSALVLNSSGHIVASVSREHNLYTLRPSSFLQHPTAFASTGSLEPPPSLSDPSILYHYRLGHCNFNYLHLMARDSMATGLPESLPVPPSSGGLTCVTCTQGKLSSTPHPPSTSRASAPLELVHMDLCGKVDPPTRHRQSYFLTIVDDFSRYSAVLLLPKKSDTTAAFQAWAKLATNKLNMPLKAIRTDGGREFLNHSMATWCQAHGIEHQHTLPDSPQQNGIAERRNRTLLNMVRCMLTFSKAPQSFWGFALLYASHILNCLPTSTLKGITPAEAWSGNKPDVSNIRIFGSTAYVLIPKEHRTKVAPKARTCVLLGLNPSAVGYLLYDPVTRTELHSQDVQFDEVHPYYATPSIQHADPPTIPFSFPTSSPPLPAPSPVLSPPHPAPSPPALAPSPSPLPSPDRSFDPPDSALGVPPIQYSTRRARTLTPTATLPPSAITLPSPSSPAHLPVLPDGGDLEIREDRAEDFASAQAFCAFVASFLADGPDPLPRFKPFYPSYGAQALAASPSTSQVPGSYQEALSSKDAPLWWEAMCEEIAAFKETGTFELVPRPKGKNIVDGKWLYKVKQVVAAVAKPHKARYVAKGFSQRQGVDYFDTFSPTAKHTTLRVLLHIAAALDLELHQMDVSVAFLQGDLAEEIYLKPAPGFEDPSNPDWVWLLKRPVYGLKQSPRQWHAKLKDTLLAMGFTPSFADPSLFIRIQPGFFVLVYVDDFTLASNSSDDLKAFKRELMQQFKMKDMGEISHYLGMTMTRDRKARTITLSQQAYIEDVLQRFGMGDCTPVKTPLPTNLDGIYTPVTEPCKHPYPQLVGCLMYAMVCTRPDLAFPVSVLSRYVAPGRHADIHWELGKRVLRYLQGTKHLALTLGGPTPIQLEGYSDASWADNQTDRRSSQGYGFSLGSGLVSWRSTRSSSVALSSTEAELYACTMAAQEATWLSTLLAEFNHPQVTPTLWCDNLSTIALAKNPMYHSRTKHIQLRHFFIREMVEEGTLLLRHVPTEDNLADNFTKPAPSADYLLSLLPKIGLLPPPAHSNGST